MRVFIEAAAGAMERGCYDEATFARKGLRKVLLPYPWPYGFVPGVPGDAVPDLAAVRTRLEAFIIGIFAAWPDMRVRLGAILPREATLAVLRGSRA